MNNSFFSGIVKSFSEAVNKGRGQKRGTEDDENYTDTVTEKNLPGKKLAKITSTEDVPSVTDILNDELETIKMSVTEKIGSLGQKLKSMEDAGKEKEMENSNLKDLLVKGMLEVKTEKCLNEELKSRNEELVGLLQQTHKTIEKSLFLVSSKLVDSKAVGIGTSAMKDGAEDLNGSKSEVNSLTPQSKIIKSGDPSSSLETAVVKGTDTVTTSKSPEASGSENPTSSNSNSSSEIEFVVSTLFTNLKNSTDVPKSAQPTNSTDLTKSAQPTNSTGDTKPAETIEMMEPELIDESLSFASLPGLDPQIKLIRENIIFPMVNIDFLWKGQKVRPAKGILFHGQRESGKNLMAKTVVAELSRHLNRPVKYFQRLRTKHFFGADDKKYWKQLFESAQTNQPSVIYIEDLETINRYSNENLWAISEYLKAIKPEDLIFVIGSTTNITSIDASLLRLEHFESTVSFDVQNVSWRKFIIEKSTKSWSSTSTPSKEILDKILEKTKDWKIMEIQELCHSVLLIAIHRQFQTNDNNLIQSTSTDTVVTVLEEDWDSGLAAKSLLVKSTAALDKKIINPEAVDPNLTFASVGGLEEQMKIIKENILFPLVNKVGLSDWGVEPVKGIVFHGPPGTGKTLLAKVIASELSRRGEQPFSFFYQKTTDVLKMHCGHTEEHLKNLFARAEAKKPAIIFFDEIDGLFSTRTGSSAGSSTKFYNGMVTAMLGLMDNIKRGEIFVIAATNRLESLDPALTRPGRFDKSLPFYPPKKDGRFQILQIHTSKWKKGNEEDILREIAKQTEGYSGADLEQLCRQTFMISLRRQFPNIETNNDWKMSEEGFKDYEILLQDWQNALGSVKPSNSNVFGNSVKFGGKRIPEGVGKLISGIRGEIVQKLLPFLKPKEESGCGIKSFLIWDTGLRQSRVIQHFIIPSLIGCEELKNTMTLTLTEAKLASTSAFETFMTQVFKESSNTTMVILYIPGMEGLRSRLQLTVGGGVSIQLFMEQMDSLRGENILLLGSGSSPISELQEEIRSIFKGRADSRSYKLRKVEREESREFFAPILEEKYPDLLERVERMMTGVDLYDILDLKWELNEGSSVGKEKEMDEMGTRKFLERILDNYETNGLDHPSPSPNHMYS